jgi:glycosyltransferase involved in cell wall biosynthesis
VQSFGAALQGVFGVRVNVVTAVSVIVPCHNRSEFIPATIESIVRQSLADWELILVDDGSEDDTFEILKNSAAGDPRIRAFRRDHEGVGAARNFGASQCSASSKYLFFLDDDDQLEPKALEQMSEYLDKHPEVGLVGCQFHEIGVDGHKIGAGNRSRWAPSTFGIPRPLRPNEYETPFATFYCATGQGPFALFRRSVFEKIGGWTTDFWPHEDTDIFCRMALLAKVHYLPDRLYRKRAHRSNVMKNTDRVMRAYDLFRRKWDNFQPRTKEEAATLRDAARFYRASFRPLRHLKVGTKALGEFVRSGDFGKLRWATTLFGCAIRDAIRYRIRPLSIF